MSQLAVSNSSNDSTAIVALPLSTTNLIFMPIDTNNTHTSNGNAPSSTMTSFPPFPHTMNTNVASNGNSKPASIAQSHTTDARPMNYNNGGNAHAHNKIIQCPNPTHNPILHHQKQQQNVMSEQQQECNVQYMEALEQKFAEQTQFIQQLMHQNQNLSAELSQSKSQVASLQAQNNALFAAYNALQSQMASNHSPTSAVSSSWSSLGTAGGQGSNGGAGVDFSALSVSRSQSNGHSAVAATVKDVYEHWNVQQVMNWMACLDGSKYAKYRHAFELNNIDGKVLNIVTREYLDRIGVKNVQHQTALLQHIEQLKQYSNSNANGYSTVY